MSRGIRPWVGMGAAALGLVGGLGCDVIVGLDREYKDARILKVASGGSHTCAILNDGSVKCWGNNSYGQLGLGDDYDRGEAFNEMGNKLLTVKMGTGKTAIAITAGIAHTCALLNDRNIKCWGSNEWGRLGLGEIYNHGANSNDMGDSLAVVELGESNSALVIAAGSYHTCSLLSNRTMKCWGHGGYGQLGLGDINNLGDQTSEMGDHLPTVILGGGFFAMAITTGYNHTCALVNGGGVKCWGKNSSGQLGLGHADNIGDGPEMVGNLLAVALGVGRTAIGIAGGGNHTCAVLNDGNLKCWGYNYSGQLGLGVTNNRGMSSDDMGDNLPMVYMGENKTIASIAAGDDHTCALLDDGNLKCWGQNGNGQLGLGDTNNRGDSAGEMGDALPAVDLGTGKTATAISAGAQHTCALLNDGSVKCWGNNSSGQLGLGDTNNRGDEPNEMGDNLPTVKLFSDLW